MTSTTLEHTNTPHARGVIWEQIHERGYPTVAIAEGIVSIFGTSPLDGEMQTYDIPVEYIDMLVMLLQTAQYDSGQCSS